MTLFVWLAAGLALLALLSGGRGAGDVALICVPLALLAGRAVERLAASWQESEFLARDAVLAMIVLVIVTYMALQVAFYARAVYTNPRRPASLCGSGCWRWRS